MQWVVRCLKGSKLRKWNLELGKKRKIIHWAYFADGCLHFTTSKVFFPFFSFLCPLGSKKNAWIWHVENKGCSIPIIMRPLLDGLQLCYSPLQKPSRIGQKLMHKKMHFMMPFLGVCFSEEEKNNKCIEPALATERFFLLCNAHLNWNWKSGYGINTFDVLYVCQSKDVFCWSIL